MQFVDETKIYVTSGHGGAGSLSFHRAKFIEFGGPDGGNGGRGADVIVRAETGLNTLVDYRFQQHFKGKSGEPGRGRLMAGESREPLILKVPVGTQILLDDQETILADMDRVGMEVVIAKGGKGGKGNAAFKTSTNQAPRTTTPGEPAEERTLYLRLKLISDVGLVGLPNAGKSTFLAATTRAKPKIADYPFTTLKPQLGVVNVGDREFVIADLPGLIEGAHEGVGLGTKFLGHVERCKILLHLVDATAENVGANYKTIRKELKAYGGLEKKVEIVALNKCDALSKKEIEEKSAELEKAARKKPMIISGVSKLGVDKMLAKLLDKIDSE